MQTLTKPPPSTIAATLNFVGKFYRHKRYDIHPFDFEENRNKYRFLPTTKPRTLFLTHLRTHTNRNTRPSEAMLLTKICWTWLLYKKSCARLSYTRTCSCARLVLFSRLLTFLCLLWWVAISTKIFISKSRIPPWLRLWKLRKIKKARTLLWIQACWTQAQCPPKNHFRIPRWQTIQTRFIE